MDRWLAVGYWASMPAVQAGSACFWRRTGRRARSSPPESNSSSVRPKPQARFRSWRSTSQSACRTPASAEPTCWPAPGSAPRWRSVFLTPTRAALLAGSHTEASAINQDRTGAGISAQAYGLRTKLFDVDMWITTTTRRVVEVHPEVSFAALAGAPLAATKHSWAGVIQRRRLLAPAGITLADDLGPAGHAGVDDILDAAVAAWTARRVATGHAEHIPDPAETFSDSRPAAIWI